MIYVSLSAGATNQTATISSKLTATETATATVMAEPNVMAFKWNMEHGVPGLPRVDAIG